ncbi:hypothetical protein CLOM621_08750 [Clostridium sp. M62/1]|nr:hypothetical protein CLOM621_08750 [Clostridium sp. M62/1]
MPGRRYAPEFWRKGTAPFFSMGLSPSAVMKSEYYFSSGRQPSRLPD